jgi:hypothetical protein
MPNISQILCESFLSNFNYCDATGKRSNTSKWKRFFLNKGLTRQLETLANQTAQKIRDIHERCQDDNLERVQEIAQIINNTIDQVWKLRIHYGFTYSRSGSHRSNGVPTYYDETTYPKWPSKFEKELESGLKAMHSTASKVLLDKQSGKLDNLDDFRDAILNIHTEQKSLRDNRYRSYSTGWAD